jgi:hypothetical protein
MPIRGRSFEAGDHLEDRVDRPGHRHRRAGDDEGLSASRPAAELHRDHREALHLAGAEDIDAVRMAQRRGELALAQEPLALFVVTSPRLRIFIATRRPLSILLAS